MLPLPWIALFLAAPATLTRSWRWAGLALLVAGYGAASASGRLGPLAIIPITLLLVAAVAVSPGRTAALRWAGHALFVALAIALAMHWLPGFHNLRVIGPQRITPDAVPFTMYLNLDKPLIGFWLLLVLPWIRGRANVAATLTCGTAGMLATAATVLAFALLLGTVAWAPKWPDHGWLWVLNNLLLVTITEEALFRGYVQGGLSRLLERSRWGATIALLASAVLFGLAHAAGGWQWMLLAGVAGIGYGLAYRRGGLSAAVLAHFGLNTLHFALFTYPMLQSAA
jgi:membrane protease YdiL (CAAX protease family)